MTTSISGTSGVNNVAPNTIDFGDLKNTLFNGLLGASGYIKIPVNDNGVFRELIVQWGSASVPAESTSTVPLPIAFPNGVFQSVATPRRNTTGSSNTSAYALATTTDITLVSDTAGTGAPTLDIQYIVLGY